MLEIEKPKLECVELAENYGKFVVEPLERGFGTTLGKSMRRVLLSSLPGVAMHTSTPHAICDRGAEGSRSNDVYSSQRTGRSSLPRVGMPGSTRHASSAGMPPASCSWT